MNKKNRIKKGKKNKDSPKLYHKDIPLDSPGEKYFCIWMDELVDGGYIEKYERCQTYSLSEPFINNFIIQLKTKGKASSQSILYAHFYTPDFKITWTEKGLNTFCNVQGEKWEKPFFVCNLNDAHDKGTSYIEAKPSFDYGNLNRLATINIKWMWKEYRIFVQMVMNEPLFKDTFVPKLLLKKQNGQDRTFKFKPKTLEEYLRLHE